MGYFLERLSGRWVAGETIESAVRVAKNTNRKGMKVLFNYIGENYRDKVLVERAVGIYLELLENIRSEELRADLSLKLSELGMVIGKGYCLKNLLEVARRARELGVNVWIDMESSRYISDTIDVYLDAFKKHKNLGVALQANMKRTREDMLKILDKKGRIRLVKGAYVGDYRKWIDIENNFSKLMGILFSRGKNFAIATNDEALLEEAKIFEERYGSDFEFQSLRGIKESLKKRLSKEYSVSDYTPFGRDVIGYVWRRFKENPGMIFCVFDK